MCVASSIVEILSNSEISIWLKEVNKLYDERYFQIIFFVLLLGSNLKSEFDWWAKWKSKIDFSDIEFQNLKMAGKYAKQAGIMGAIFGLGTDIATIGIKTGTPDQGIDVGDMP